MTELQRLLDDMAGTPGCRVSPPSGQPVVRQQERLPGDLEEFYRRCGGVWLFEGSHYEMRIVGPGELIRANPEIVGEECPEDITDSWYIVARGGSEEMLSIDCSPERLGRCYDSFWDTHGMAGNCPVIALSFTELLQRLFENRGAYWYWLGESAPSYGDAYAGTDEAALPT